ncbi:Transcription repressor OFP16 [Linum perenne]
MPKALGRNLHSCFSVVTKRPNLLPPPSSQHHHNHQNRQPNLFKSYNSLYEETSQLSPPSPPPLLSPSSSSSSSTATTTSEPDFATAFASDRFFFSSPGRSNSIVDSSSSGSTDQELLPAGRGIAVPTYSPDPYRDFRQSMQEMVDATRGRGVLVDVGSSWDYLHELLLSYLALNPKSTHKFIVCAFADLLVNLLSSDTRDGGALIERGGNKVQLTKRVEGT